MTTFQPGQHVIVSDGTLQTVAAVIERPGEAARLQDREGREWLAANCSLSPDGFPPNGGHRESCAYVGGYTSRCTC